MAQFSFDQQSRVTERENELRAHMANTAGEFITDVVVHEAEGLYRIIVHTNGARGLPTKMDFIQGTHMWKRFLETFESCWNTWKFTAAPIKRQMAAKGFPYVGDALPEQSDDKTDGDGTITVAM